MLVQARTDNCCAIPTVPRRRSAALPSPAYDLVDFEAYARVSGRPEAALRHQHRLPVRVQLLHGHGVLQPPLQSAGSGRRRAKRSSELVRRHRLNEVALVDSNFLVDVHRARGHRARLRRQRSAFPMDVSGIHRSSLPDER